jgi:hypothetical protein
VRHRHPMPFGAEVLGNGEARFSLLAPASETVKLILEGEILPMRHEEIVPRIFGFPGEAAFRPVGERGVRAEWTLGDGYLLTLLANLGPEPLGGFEQATGELLYATGGVTGDGPKLPGWSVGWYLREAG